MTRSILLTAFAIVIFTSCEKVIEIDLNEADRKLVVEAFVSNDSTFNYTKITKTGSFYQTDAFETVKGAKVTLSDEFGNSYSTTEKESGYYYYNNFTANSNTKYTLFIEAENEKISAETYLPELTKIDSLGFEFREATGFYEAGYSVSAYFTDNGNVKNYYRFKVYKSDSLFDNLFYLDDQFYNGISGRANVWQLSFQKNDTVNIDMISIDQYTYNYLAGLEQIIDGGGQSAAPGNPQSNIKGNAIGIFSGYNLDKQTIIIK